MKKIVLVCSVLITASLHAQTVSTNSFPSAGLSFSPFSIAAGGQVISHPNAQLGLYTDNPALLDSISDRKLQLSYTRHLAKTNATQVFYAWHSKGNNFSFAYGIKYFGFGEMGKYDELGAYLGDLKAMDGSLKGIASYALDSNWTLGGASSLVLSQIDRNTMLAQTFDFGAHYLKRKGNWTFDVLLRNVGFKYGGSGIKSQYEIPTQWQLGFSKKPKNAPFRLMVTLNQLHELRNPSTPVVYASQEPKWISGDQLMRRATIGTEVMLGNLHFMAGYNYQRRADLRLTQAPGLSGISMGLGIYTQRWQITYAWSKYHTSAGVSGFQLIFQPFSSL